VPTYIDHLQRLINIDIKPKRIISLVPSQTELLCDLGLTDEVIGITKFCIHPNEWFKNKTRIGGTKNIDIDKVKNLQPDLIIANKEENTKTDIEQLEKIAPVWISDITNLQDALQMIERVGSIVNKAFEANEICDKIKTEFEILNQFVANQLIENLTCCYIIWQKPYMSIGADTFINSMLQLCGLTNIYVTENRYPEISIENLIAIKPNVVMLSSEPFPFKEEHLQELQNLLPNSKVFFVDGEMFSWYGSRLLKAPKYFIELLQKNQ
jgi:ABC-type Fe3+-hydroxamate transport system substrate-binding protein